MFSAIPSQAGGRQAHISGGFLPGPSQRGQEITGKLLFILLMDMVFVSPERMFVETHSDPNSVYMSVRPSVR